MFWQDDSFPVIPANHSWCIDNANFCKYSPQCKKFPNNYDWLVRIIYTIQSFKYHHTIDSIHFLAWRRQSLVTIAWWDIITFFTDSQWKKIMIKFSISVLAFPYKGYLKITAHSRIIKLLICLSHISHTILNKYLWVTGVRGRKKSWLPSYGNALELPFLKGKEKSLQMTLSLTGQNP